MASRQGIRVSVYDCGRMYQVKKNLQDAQKKVDNSKVEITRVKNELQPLEVRGGCGYWVWL